MKTNMNVEFEGGPACANHACAWSAAFGPAAKGGRAQALRSAWALAFVMIALSAQGQTLRFGNHRELAVPDYATVRIGPFYSSLSFSQSAGYRYTRSSGVGTDFFFRNHRGRIVEDGEELPLVSSLDTRNYLIVTRNMDLDVSASAVYSHYPFGTQEDSFEVNLAEEGMFGNLSSEVQITPFMKAFLHEAAVYRTDYVDTRGITDEYGGRQNEYFRNTAGMDVDWLMAEDMNAGVSLSRTDMLPRNDEFADQECVSWHESAAFERKISPALVAGVQAGFDQNQYTAQTATNRPDTSSETYSAYASARLTENTIGSASAGYSLGRVKGSQDSADETVVGSLRLKTILTRELSQTMEVSRSRTAGFNSPFEIQDTASYGLEWKGEATSLRLSTALTRVDPGWKGVSSYSDWTTALDLAQPVYVGLSFLDTVTLVLTSRYSVRNNGEVPEGVALEALDPEWVEEYRTWTTRLGASFPFFFQDCSFSAYAEHTERTSDSGLLDYTRDTVEVTVVYSHQF